MPQGLQNWSKTAASNATADSSINWAEGQSPSSVNDSARAVMARIAEWRDDLAGITTTGTATAYALTTNRVFTTLALMDKAIVTIIPHVTSGVDPTLNVDALGAKQIRTATGVNVPSGALVAGTPYALVYVNASTEFILLGATALTNDLAALEALSTTGTPRRTGTDTWVLADDIASITWVMVSPGGGALATGISGDLEIPFACTVQQVTLLADQTGSIVVDIWKQNYTNYPPIVGNSMTASAKPTISAAAKSQDATLTGWSTTIFAGDILRFNIDSCSTITRCTLALKVKKTY